MFVFLFGCFIGFLSVFMMYISYYRGKEDGKNQFTSSTKKEINKMTDMILMHTNENNEECKRNIRLFNKWLNDWLGEK